MACIAHVVPTMIRLHSGYLNIPGVRLALAGSQISAKAL